MQGKGIEYYGYDSGSSTAHSISLETKVTDPGLGPIVDLTAINRPLALVQYHESLAHQRGLSTALHWARPQRTGSYAIGGRSGLSFSGVTITAIGTTCRHVQHTLR